jgi:hypothetical protein
MSSVLAPGSMTPGRGDQAAGVRVDGVGTRPRDDRQRAGIGVHAGRGAEQRAGIGVDQLVGGRPRTAARRRSDSEGADRYASLQLAGIQGPDPHRIYQVVVNGCE